MSDDILEFSTDSTEPETEQTTTTTIDDVESTPKRKRGRPRKNVAASESTGESVAAETPKPKARVRRAKKLSGADVAAGVETATAMLAMMGGPAYAHWTISEQEFASVADAWAELLNRIPAHYVRGAFDAAGYLSLAVGTYMIVAPRVAMTQAIKAQEKAERETPDDTIYATGGVEYAGGFAN